MRDTAHYRNLMARNPSASVGFTLAASAVYSALHGQCEIEEKSSDEWRRIARDLRQRYGENLSADEVIAEMNAVQGSPQRTVTKRLRLTPAEAERIEHAASEAGVTLSQYIRSKIL